MRIPFAAAAIGLITACGVEETGYLTEDGVFFTEDTETASRIVVVTPDAVDTLGGTLALSTVEGEVEDPQVLDDGGAVWVLGQTEGIVLTYTLEGRSDSREVAFALDGGAPPTEDPQSLLGWVSAEGDGLILSPAMLLGELPFFVINQANGANLVIDAIEERPLAGGAGDRVCVSTRVGDALTESLCIVVP